MSWCHHCTYQAQTWGEHQPADLDQGPRPETNHVLNVVIEAVGTLPTKQHREKVRDQIGFVSFKDYSHQIPNFFYPWCLLLVKTWLS